MSTQTLIKLTNILNIRRGESGEGWLGGPLWSPAELGGDTRPSLTT
jgi:hypothetical protein